MRRTSKSPIPEKVVRAALASLEDFAIGLLLRVRVEEVIPEPGDPQVWDVTLSFLYYREWEKYPAHSSALPVHRYILRVDVTNYHVRSARMWESRQFRE